MTCWQACVTWSSNACESCAMAASGHVGLDVLRRAEHHVRQWGRQAGCVGAQRVDLGE